MRLEKKKVEAVLATLDPPKPKAKPKKAPGKSHTWTPTDASIQATITYLRDVGKATRKDVGVALGLSTTAATVVLNHMRKEGLVRLAGKDGQARLYALMKNGGEQ